MTTPAHDEAPSVLGGRYRLERELGRGGMATVHLAEDLRHRRRVAIKVLRPELAHGLSAERFLREVDITARLLHPHILSLFDSGEDEGLPWYAMPFVEGESLRERLRREGELGLDAGLRLLGEVADALAYAHEHGFVHRDIKPENVLLSGDHALVADFGVAKALAASRAAPPGEVLTMSGAVVGTPAYMSPEQAAGDPQVDRRSDIYALGVLAYELFAGAPPFTGPTAQQVMVAHVMQEPVPLGRLRPILPTAVVDAVMRCLEKRPADRWESAGELARRLDTARSVSVVAGSVEVAREPVDHVFRLDEQVCRKLDRATLDPRVIGGVVHYLDNEVESPVLVCFLHGTGYDQRQFGPILERLPFRGIAPTLYGFEPAPPRRVALTLDDHLTVLAELLRDAIARCQPTVTLLAGFSSGADAVLRLAADEARRPPVDGVLALGANLSVDTCFVTGLFARMEGDDPAAVLEDLRSLGADAASLEEWLNIHEYFVATLRKFHGAIGPLRRFASDIVRPFLEGGDPFAAWFRGATAGVARVRCVFEETPMIDAPLRALRLRNLDEGVLGPRYDAEAIVTEPGTDHFDLIAPSLVRRHVDALVAGLLRGR